MINKIEYLREPFLEGSLKGFNVKIDDYTITVDYDPIYKKIESAYTLDFTYRKFEDVDASNDPKSIWSSIESFFNLVDWIKNEPESYGQYLKECKPWLSIEDAQRIIDGVTK